MKQRSLKIVFFLFVLSVWGILGAVKWDYLLPVNSVSCVCESGQYLWFGTPYSGLIRYHPSSSQIKQYHMANSGLPSNEITAVAAGKDGKVWVGTNAGLAAFDGSTWEAWTPQQLYPDADHYPYSESNVVSGVMADESGNIWVTLQFVEWGDDDGSRYLTDMVALSPSGSKQTFQIEGDMKLIGSYAGKVYASMVRYEEEGYTRYRYGGILLCFDNGRISTHNLISDPDLQEYNFDFSLNTSGELAVNAIYEDFLRIFTIPSDNAQSWNYHDIDVPEGSVTLSKGVSSHSYLSSTDGKVYMISGNKLEQVDLPGWYGYTELIQCDLFTLPQDKLIVTMNSEVALKDCAMIEKFSINPYPFDNVLDLSRDASGILWIFSGKTLAAFDGSGWRVIPTNFETDHIHCYGWEGSLAVSGSGEIWLGYEGGLYRVSGNTLEFVREATDLVNIQFDQQDRLWVLCENKLLQFAGGQWKQISNQESGLPSSGLVDMYIDHADKVWVLGPQNLYSFDGSRWSSMSAPDRAYKLTVDGNNGIHVLAHGQLPYLSSYVNKKWKTSYDTYPGLWTICSDHKRSWWGWNTYPGGGGGVAVSGRTGEVEGSPWGGCNKILIDDFNNKWFVTDKGLAIYNEDGVDYQYPNAEVEPAESVIHFTIRDIMGKAPAAGEARIICRKKNDDMSLKTFDVLNGEIRITEAMLLPLLADGFNITSINLVSKDYALIGHIDFAYTMDNLSAGQKITGDLIIGPVHVPGEPLWEYYADGEHMVSLLIQPEEILPGRKPLVLVHGIGGSYPYFSEPFISQLNANPDRGDMFDIWQFYYPYDQQIEQSAPLLGEALEIVQSKGYRQNNGRVNILAHSMGGLVTRALIQNLNPEFGYQNNIEKFCMLGTPNHGSHSAFRISHFSDYPTSYLYNDWNDLQDQNSPAIRQLYPGSAFLTALNLLPPDRLYPGSDISDIYLVVAGTHNRLHPWVAESSLEINDDIVVALSSASLMDYGIPLATVYYDHMRLAGEIRNDGSSMDSSFLADFFADDYSPEQTDLSSYLTNFWLSPPGAEADPLASILNLRIEGVKLFTPLRVIIDAKDRVVKLYMGLVDQVAGELLPQQMKRDLIPCEIDEDNSITYTFMENEPGASILPGTNLTDVKYLASPLDPGSYRVELYDARKDLIWANNDYLNVQNGCTSSIEIILSGDFPWGGQDGNNTSSTSAPEGMVYVPGGTFTMGDTRGEGYSDELPTHSVTMSPFYIGRYEVTQAEYAQYMQPDNSWTSRYGLGDNYPAYFVSWYSILKYCNLRSLAEGLAPVYTISGSTNPANWGDVPISYNTAWDAVICNWNANGYRLPTEAEWEYAARGATNNPDYLYSGSNDINAVAWYDGNNDPWGSKPVGTKSPNGISTYDMSGNVFEWCWDWYSAYGGEGQINPTGPLNGPSRLLRGGNWYNLATYCRVSYRYDSDPYSGIVNFGFRLCRAIN